MKQFFIFALLIAGVAFGMETDKTYVDSENILVGQNGIFVSLDGNIFNAKSLSFDEDGLYIFSSELIESPKAWVCGRCGGFNWCWAEECSNCGRRR